jgi:SAM-dependent methyltransferase
MPDFLERYVSLMGLSGNFYVETIRKAIAQGHLTADMKVLAICGGEFDRTTLMECGLRNVTIANLDTRMKGNEYAPYEWSFQDAESMTFEDQSFDFAIAHSGLHHCRTPHLALCEMYRVSRLGVIVFEPYDGLLSGLAVRANLGQEYEVAAVFDNGMTFGGVQNTEIPNFVYRWTESEVKKAIKSYDPTGRQYFHFFYATRIPWGRLKLLRSRIFEYAVVGMLPVIKVVSMVFPKTCNNFAFMVRRPSLPDGLMPWLRMDEGKAALNRDWLIQRYAK